MPSTLVHGGTEPSSQACRPHEGRRPSETLVVLTTRCGAEKDPQGNVFRGFGRPVAPEAAGSSPGARSIISIALAFAGRCCDTLPADAVTRSPGFCSLSVRLPSLRAASTSRTDASCTGAKVLCRFDADKVLAILDESFSGGTLPARSSVAPERRTSASWRRSSGPNKLARTSRKSSPNVSFK